MTSNKHILLVENLVVDFPNMPTGSSVLHGVSLSLKTERTTWHCRGIRLREKCSCPKSCTAGISCENYFRFDSAGWSGTHNQKPAGIAAIERQKNFSGAARSKKCHGSCFYDGKSIKRSCFHFSHRKKREKATQCGYFAKNTYTS